MSPESILCQIFISVTITKNVVNKYKSITYCAQKGLKTDYNLLICGFICNFAPHGTTSV